MSIDDSFSLESARQWIKAHLSHKTLIAILLILFIDSELILANNQDTSGAQIDWRSHNAQHNNESSTSSTSSESIGDGRQVINITQVLFEKFNFVFQDATKPDHAYAPEGLQQQQHQNDQSGILSEPSDKSKQQLDRLTEFFVISSQHELACATSANQSVTNSTEASSASSPNDKSSQQTQSNLETRTNLLSGHFAAQQQQQIQNEVNNADKKNFIRILNRVFSRVELPEIFRRPTASTTAGGQSRTSSSTSANLSIQTSSISSSSTTSSTHCGNHIGCIAELPNFPIILKLKPNVSASFTVYTREKGHRHGQRIVFEPLVHYQLQDGHHLNDLELQKELEANLTRQLKLDKGASFVSQSSSSSSSSSAASIMTTTSQRRRQASGHKATLSSGHKQLLSTTSSSWMSDNNKIIYSREFPFDLAALERSGFNASLTTRIIIGGYFAKEDEEWIDELIKQWLLLEPQNVIKVSWQDSNRGLYHSAAYNSRIVGRQLSLFLHYLNELFHIDLNRLHLVGHSLGAHIAGFVGADNEGQIARITGLDPAGPIFVELNAAHRLDSSDAKFVDVVHTNGGTITKGALGLSTPSGHVDYYSNGGSLQPGCFFSSVTMSIMDPVERIACNHRRSYRYFTEVIKLAIKERDEIMRDKMLASYETTNDNSPMSGDEMPLDFRRFPQAFLFEAKQDELAKLVQPDIKLVGLTRRRSEWLSTGGNDSKSENNQMKAAIRDNNELQVQEAPLQKVIEFHSLNPDFPRSKHGLYYFRTRTEVPFFGSKQYALRLRVDQPIRRKIMLSIKINTTLVAELELDELDDSRSLVFVLQNPNLIDYGNLFSGRSSRAPDLWLMWRQRSFNLLLAHQASELHLNSIELNLLDDNELGPSLEVAGGEGGSKSTQIEEQASESTGVSERDNGATRPAQQRKQATSNTFIIRYEPNLVNNNVKNNENFLTRIQHNTNAREATGSLGLGGSSGGGFVMARNQWHKFDGRPVALASSV